MDMIKKDLSDIFLYSIKDNTKYRTKITDLICRILDISEEVGLTDIKVMYYCNDVEKLIYMTEYLKNKYPNNNDIKLCCFKYNKNIRNYNKEELRSEINDIFDSSNQINGRCILTTNMIKYDNGIYDKGLQYLIIDLAEPDGILQLINSKYTGSETCLHVYINEQSRTKLKAICDYKLSDDDLTESFLENSMFDVIYDKLKNTGIKNGNDVKKIILKESLEACSNRCECIDKDYVKTLLSDIGKPAKQINNVNKALKQLQLPYKIVNKREKIKGHENENGKNNPVNVWYVKELSNE